MITTSRDEKFEDYSKYLSHSKHWRAIKTKFRNSCKPDIKCETCGSTYRLVVHHKTYERVGNEQLEDLSMLCRACHLKVHGRSKDKTPYVPTPEIYDTEACLEFLSNYEHEIAPYL